MRRSTENEKERVREKYKLNLNGFRDNRKISKRKDYLKNKKAYLKRAIKWRNDHPTKLAEYYLKNRKKINQRHAKWKKENKIKVNSLNQRRRTKKKGAEGLYTHSDIMRILKSQKHRCAYCRKNLNNKYHVDHIRAIANGGSNWPRNIQCLCPSCNMQKHTTDPLVFARQIGKLL